MVEYYDTLETERREKRGIHSRPTHWRRPLYSTEKAHALDAAARGEQALSWILACIHVNEPMGMTTARTVGSKSRRPWRLHRTGMARGRIGAPVAPCSFRGAPIKTNSYTLSRAKASKSSTSMMVTPRSASR